MKIDHTSWQPAGPAFPDLPTAEVHVWRVSVDRTGPLIPWVEPVLATEEKARAAAFRREADRQRSILGRGLLRILLGRYLTRAAAKIAFTYNPHGKPALAGSPGAGGVEFNLSHSGDWILFAMARGGAVGVDVEQFRPLEEWEQIASMFYSPRETAWLRGLRADQREPAFFQTWARKEACLKAVGKGLSIPLSEVEVYSPSGEPMHSVQVRQASGTTTLFLQDLSVGPGYAAALAGEGNFRSVRCWEFPEGLIRIR